MFIYILVYLPIRLSVYLLMFFKSMRVCPFLHLSVLSPVELHKLFIRVRLYIDLSIMFICVSLCLCLFTFLCFGVAVSSTCLLTLYPPYPLFSLPSVPPSPSPETYREKGEDKG